MGTHRPNLASRNVMIRIIARSWQPLAEPMKDVHVGQFFESAEEAYKVFAKEKPTAWMIYSHLIFVENERAARSPIASVIPRLRRLELLNE